MRADGTFSVGRRRREGSRPPSSDPILEMAYDAGRAMLREQDTTLNNLRGRAVGLLSASALTTTFATAIGLLNVDPARGRVFPGWAAWILLGSLVLIGAAVLVVLWPVSGWCFAPDAGRLVRSAGKDLDAVRRSATEAMIEGARTNTFALQVRMAAFQLAAMAFLLEVVALAVALAVQGR